MDRATVIALCVVGLGLVLATQTSALDFLQEEDQPRSGRYESVGKRGRSVEWMPPPLRDYNHADNHVIRDLTRRMDDAYWSSCHSVLCGAGGR